MEGLAVFCPHPYFLSPSIITRVKKQLMINMGMGEAKELSAVSVMDKIHKIKTNQCTV
jgi:hypothetical protein